MQVNFLMGKFTCTLLYNARTSKSKAHRPVKQDIDCGLSFKSNSSCTNNPGNNHLKTGNMLVTNYNE